MDLCCVQKIRWKGVMTMFFSHPHCISKFIWQEYPDDNHGVSDKCLINVMIQSATSLECCI